MSKWFDQSNNANKLRQSYLKGFLDISGGGLNMRSDNSMNFYYTNSALGEAVPGFGIDASSMYYLDPSYGTIQEISNNSIHYLQHARADLQDQIDYIVSGGGSARLTTADIQSFNATNANISGRLTVGGDGTFGGNLVVAHNITVGGDLLVMGDEIIKEDLSVDGNVVIRGYTYMNDYLVMNGANSHLYVGQNADVSGSFSVINGDVSFNHRLSVGTDASFGNNVDIAGTLHVHKLIIGDNADSGQSGVTMTSLNLNDAFYVQNTADFDGSVNIVGDASLGKTLTVGGVTTLKSKVIAQSDASLNANLMVGASAWVGSNVDISGTLHAVGVATLDNKLTVKQDASLNTNLAVGSTLKVGSSADISGTFHAVGASTLDSTLTVKSDASLNSNLAVGASVKVASNVDISGTLHAVGVTTLDNKLNVANDASLNTNLAVGSTLKVGSSADISGTFHAVGASTLDSTLTVKSDASLNTNLAVGASAKIAANLDISGTLHAVGVTTLDAQLNVANDVSMNTNLAVGSTLKVASSTDISGTLHAVGVTTLDNKLNVANDVSLNTNLAVGSKLKVASNVDVSGTFHAVQNATLDSNLYVNGTTALNGSLAAWSDASFAKGVNVVGDVSFNSRLFVNHDASFNGKLGVNLDASFGSSVFVGGLQLAPAYSTAFSSGSNQNAIIAQNGTSDINIVPAAGGSAYIRGALHVDGSFSMTGDFTQINTQVTSTDSFSVINAGTTDALKVLQTGGSAIATFNYYDAQSVERASLFVDYNGFVGIGDFKHTAAPSYKLDVSGSVHTNSDITVDGNYSSTNGNFTLTNGNVTLTQGNLTIGNASVTNTINGKLNLGKDLTMTGGNLVLSGPYSANGQGFIAQW